MAAVLNIDIHVNDDGSLAIRKVSEEAKKAEQSTNNLSRSTNNLGSSFSSLKSIIGFIGIAQLSKETIQAADSFKLMEGRLSLVTKGTIELATAQQELFKISQNTRQSFKDTVDLYTSLARSTQQLGKSQKETLAVTETINKAIIISGASAESSKAALIQLGQGFASGTLRGEELNSVLEQTPRIAEAIAKGMNITVGELRAMGAEGKLTGEAVFEALQKQAKAVDEEFSKLPKTVGQATVTMGNAMLDFVGTIDKATGASSLLADTISTLSSKVSEYSREIKASTESVFEQKTVDQISVKANQIADEIEKLKKSMSEDDGFLWFGLDERTTSEYQNKLKRLEQQMEQLGNVAIDVIEKTNESTKKSSVLPAAQVKEQVTNALSAYEKYYQAIGDNETLLQIKRYDYAEKYKDLTQSQIDQIINAERNKINKVDDLNKEWSKRKLDLIYETSISEQDAFSKPYIELEKKYNEDLEKYGKLQGAKELITKEYQAKTQALNKETVEKFTKQEEEKYKKSNEWQVKLFDANEKINDQFIAQREKMYGATSEAQIEAWYQNQLEWLGKLALEGKATSEELQGLLDKINSLKNLKLQEQTLSFKVEKSFYNSLESGLTNTIEDAFNGDDLNLNSFFKNIKKGLVNTISSDMSGGIVNNFKTFTGFGGAASLVGSTLSASDMNSLISSGATVSDGVIKTAGGTVIDQASGTVTSQGSDALSLLNTASSLKTAYGLISNGISVSIISGFQSVSGLLAQAGFNTASSGLMSFGTGVANPFAYSGMSGLPTSMTAGSALSGTLMGGLAGYGIGSLGDKIFGASTYAGTTGAIGGALGGLGGAVGLWGGPIGIIAGSIIGSVLGGIFGKTKQTGAGIDILGNATAQDASGQYWTSYKKKSWFSSKSWTNYTPFSDEEIEAIKSTIGVYDYLLSQLGEYNDLVVEGGRFSSLQNFLDTNVVKAFLKSINPENLDIIYQSWTDYAAEIDKTVTEAIATAVSGYTTYKRGYTEWFLGSGTVEQLEFTANYLQKDFEALASSLGASSVTVDNFLSMYDAAIKNNFTQDTIEAWASLGDALMKSTDASKKYKDALDDLNQSTAITYNDMMLSKVNDQTNLVSQLKASNDMNERLLVNILKVLKQTLDYNQLQASK